LCLCAGLDLDFSFKIAYSSQYVDDSTESKKIYLYDKKGKEIGFIDPIRTAHNGLESFWQEVWEKVYYPFHFIPGNEGEGEEEKYITTAGCKNVIANELLNLAIKTENPYRIGIALHAYADTFSHQNFSGRWSEVNSVKKLFVYSNLSKKLVFNLKLLLLKILRKPIPAIGHVEAYKVPDISYYNWVYFNYRNKYIPASNETRYMNFTEDVYKNYLCKLSLRAGENEPEEFDNLRDKILRGINVEGSLKKRCKYWKKLIMTKLGYSKYPKEYDYHRYKWRKEAFFGRVSWDREKRLDRRIIKMIPRDNFPESNWVNFHRSALAHRKEALKILFNKGLSSKNIYEQVLHKIVGIYKGENL
jgi:hypothetical protein